MDNTFANIGSGHSCLDGHHGNSYAYSLCTPGRNITTAYTYSRNELLIIDTKYKLHGYKLPIRTLKKHSSLWAT
jgi:hypothetical protein